MNLNHLFSQSHALPTISKVVQELIIMLHDENVSISEVARKIELDQVIAAKLLRLANSASYGRSRRIGSVDKAIQMLGFSTTRALVISVGLSGCFKNIPNVDLPVFWRHCIRVACVARALAKPARVEPDLAFTLGLMYAIGHLLMALGLPEMEEFNVLHPLYSDARRAAEEETFGYSFAEVSAELMQRWNFATEFEAALLNFHMPLDVYPFEPLAGVLHLAVWRVFFEAQGQGLETMFDNWPHETAQRLGISAAFIEALAQPKDLTADLEVMLG